VHSLEWGLFGEGQHFCFILFFIEPNIYQVTQQPVYQVWLLLPKLKPSFDVQSNHQGHCDGSFGLYICACASSYLISPGALVLCFQTVKKFNSPLKRDLRCFVGDHFTPGAAFSAGCFHPLLPLVSFSTLSVSLPSNCCLLQHQVTSYCFVTVSYKIYASIANVKR